MTISERLQTTVPGSNSPALSYVNLGANGSSSNVFTLAQEGPPLDDRSSLVGKGSILNVSLYLWLRVHDVGCRLRTYLGVTLASPHDFLVVSISQASVAVVAREGGKYRNINFALFLCDVKFWRSHRFFWVRKIADEEYA